MRLATVLGLTTVIYVAQAAPESSWEGWGGSIYNNRWASTNHAISSSNIKSLTEHCKITYVNGTSATPTISHGIAYYPTWNGSFVALDYQDCNVKWQINVTAIIEDYAPISAEQRAIIRAVSRTSPQINGDVLYFGSQTHSLIVAVDLRTGKTLGVTQINPHPMAIVTLSPTFYKGLIFAGASSAEETAAAFIPGYNCCSFVGNVVALRFDHTGNFATVWNVTTLPPGSGEGNGTWSGAAVWGSQPSIDTSRRQVLFATGNVYSAPEEFLKCDAVNENAMSGNASCVLPPDVWQESVLALDIYSGQPKWVRQLSPLDAWTVACGVPSFYPGDQALCPPHPGPDADFGMAPAFVSGSRGALTPSDDDVVTLGQKNGNLYALAADNGSVMWSTVTSPGGLAGGLSWGVGVDNQRVYFTAINSLNRPWRLQPANTTSITNSGFGAASLTNGSLLWEIGAPQNNSAYVPPTVVGDVVISGRSGPAKLTALGAGGLLVMEKETGNILVDYALDTTFRGGIAVQDRYIMFGTGYNGAPSGSFYVLAVGT
ncbi:quinon protein alcohol dehydrogenase-like superfamily [Ilyonectria destructans]|nr:quinon protein alcohol dehydrogenase-like superfamily [Ilyonectria destructans]